MKKIVLVGCILVSAVLFTGCSTKSGGASPAPTARARKVDVNVNLEPIQNRPYVALIPRADGRAVTLTVQTMKKQAADLEYEIEYASGDLMQGAFGTVSSLGTLPTKTEVLFGSCSSGGKCTYNENITGGNLTLRFGSPDFTLKSEWSYTNDLSTSKTHTSRDGRFVLDFGTTKLAKKPLLIHTASGYPETLARTVIAGPYMLSSNDALSGTVKVSLRLPTEANDGAVFAFDGTAWSEVKALLSDRMFSFTAPIAQGYVVVAK